MAAKFIRGINLFYDDLGSGSPIVFVHGQPFNRSMWKYQVEYFQHNYRLIIPDLRGYGQSKTNDHIILLDEIALDIMYLLDELQIEKAIFCGLSMGGQILLDIYRLFPHRVKALIIADSDARGESEESYRNRLALANRLLSKGMHQYTSEHIHEYIGSNTQTTRPDAYQHLFEMMTSTDAAGAAAVQRGRADRRDHVSILSSIKVPALIIAGSEDYFTPLPVAAIMAENIPGAQFISIDDAGHMPNMERPEEFNAAVSSFLNQNNFLPLEK